MQSNPEKSAMKLKQPSNSATIASTDTRLLVRETLRISANLASAAPPNPSAAAVTPERQDLRLGGLANDQFVDSSLRVICCEEIDGRRWRYFAENDGFRSHESKKLRKNCIRAVSLQSPQAPVDELMAFIRSYVVPEGFPDSVTPSYVPYMTWRALKYFFGGAMGVFTTQTLLSSVGVSRNRAVPGAVAINWIIKDGAGRVGKMLFARQGKKFDYDLKQLRFAGDIMMELGAGLELATAAVPHLFLPLACLANVSKVKSVVLQSLNRARFTVAVESFLKTGQVPTLHEGNSMENIFNLPWKEHRPIVLGPRFKDAFQDPNSYLAVEPIFEKEQYIVTYNPYKGKIYALFKDQAKSDDILKAAFHAYVLLHIVHTSNKNLSSPGKQEHDFSVVRPTLSDLQSHNAESYKMVSALYGLFKNKATEQGWVMSESLLNPGRARLCELGG